MKDLQTTFNTEGVFDLSPLVVMTGFTSEKHHQLMTTMMQKMFPTLNPSEMDIKKAKVRIPRHFELFFVWATMSLLWQFVPLVSDLRAAVLLLQRVLLLHYDEKKDLIRFRHYGITLRTPGISKGIRPIRDQKLPTNLDGMRDISEIITRGGYGSVRRFTVIFKVILWGFTSNLWEL